VTLRHERHEQGIQLVVTHLAQLHVIKVMGICRLSVEVPLVLGDTGVVEHLAMVRLRPLRLAHLDDGDGRAILLQSGQGPARFK
jgi:hypothetical protein